MPCFTSVFELTLPVGYVACALWFFYFTCMCIVHHRRTRIRASRILISFGLLATLFCIANATVSFISYNSILLSIIAFDILLAGTIIFDVLYKDFFHDGGKYTIFFGKRVIPVVIGWGVSHAIVIIHENNIFTGFFYSLVGFYSIGPVLIVYMLVKLGQQLKSLESYVFGEYKYEHVETEKRKMLLVHKQYKFIKFSFFSLAFVPILDVIGFSVLFLFGDIILREVCSALTIIFLFLGCSFQVLGFFYPVPRIKEFLVDTSSSNIFRT